MSIRNTTCHVCDFCGKTQHEVKKIVAGPDVDICGECILLAVEAGPANRLICDFCGKGDSEVKILLEGKGSHICDECVRLSQKIVEHYSDEWFSYPEAVPEKGREFWVNWDKPAFPTPVKKWAENLDEKWLPAKFQWRYPS